MTGAVNEIGGAPTPAEVRRAAHAWHTAGFAAVPARTDGSKRPALKTWKRYSRDRILPTDAEHDQWFSGQPRGLGLLCGAVSGGLEMFELEGRAIADGARDELLPALRDAGVFDVWRRLVLVNGYAEFSPSGGLHVLYRITDHDVPGNTKIAQRPARPDELTDDEREVLAKKPDKVFTRCLAETRGDGGFVVVAPSHGPTHETGRPWQLCEGSTYGNVPQITWEERNALHSVVRMVLDRAPEPAAPPSRPRSPATAGAGERPGDAWARQTSWADILQPHGWKWIRRNGDMDYWTRPGKKMGVSARTGGQYDALWAWSTSTTFPAEQSITKFRAYAILEHDGSDQAATVELRRRGFGDKPAERGVAVNSEPAPGLPDDGSRPNLDEFWTARRPLNAIRATARERLVSPWATLGGVLAHVCSRVGPHVVLPPIVGSIASLNTFWAFVGSSAAGKDAALAVSHELLWLDDDVPTHEVGTGQGIDSAYTTQTKGGPVQFCDAALFTATEIDTIAAHASTAGATLMATLRKVYSGAALGARYADKQKRRPVRAHRYRAALVAGVQPARSAVLLGDADGGTPQRWLWMPTNDPGAGERHAQSLELPVTPQGELWQRYEYLDAYGEMDDDEPVPQRARVEIKVCDTARTVIVEHRQARLAAPLVGSDDDMNGHALLTRLKVAALLALFDGGRAEITDEDWELSGVVMTVSDATREVCTRALTEKARKANVAKAKQEIERADITADHTEKRVAAALLRTMRRRGEWVSRSELRRTLRGTADREFFDPAIERLRAAGQVVEEESERGVRFRCPID